MADYYRHSGIVPTAGLIQTIFAGVGTAISLGIVYAYASVYLPFLYVHFLLTGAFGLALGRVVQRSARSGRIRNRLVPAAIGLASGVVGLYFAWGGDILARKMLPPNGGFLTAFRPLVLWSYMRWAFDNGLWAIGRNANAPMTGIALAVVWLVEAAIIVGMATYFPWNEIRQWVFCEHCGWWGTMETIEPCFASESPENIAARLKEDDLGVLGEMPLAKLEDLTFLRLHLATCDTCDQSNYFDLVQVTLKIDKKGNVQTKTKSLVEKLAVAAAAVPLVRNAGQAPAVAPPIAAADVT